MLRLALAMGKSVTEIEEWPVTELREWMAFDRYLEPFGREWNQAGVIAAAAIAPHVGKGRQPRPEDFMPLWQVPQTAEEIAAELSKLRR